MPKKNSEQKRKKTIVLLVLLTLIIGYVILNHFNHIASFFNVENINQQVENAGMFGPLLFILLMVLAVVISPIPSLPLDVAAGVVWGPILATLYASIGAVIGAMIAFSIARYLGKGVLEKHFSKQMKICYNCSERYLFFLVLIARLFPFFQFDIISYGAGLTNMKLRNFAIASFIGMLPMTYVFASLGESFVVGNGVIGIIATLLIIAGFFVVPILIEKHNFLWLKGKIVLK